MRTLLVVSLLAACGGSEEAVTVDLPVTTAAGAIPPAMTDLGYQVQLERLRIAVTTVQFTIEGETHTEARIAAPHPGHAGGGEVTGELPGDFVLEWNGQVQPMLGIGSLITGDYHGANFTFRAAAAADNLATGDRLLGHAFAMSGTIAKDGTTRPFLALLDVEPDTAVTGAVFEDVIGEASTATLAIQFLPTDPYELDTPFDGIDFFALPETSGVIEILPGSNAHNILRRVIQTHDHYAVVAQEKALP
jgi:hypothetical protein